MKKCDTEPAHSRLNCCETLAVGELRRLFTGCVEYAEQFWSRSPVRWLDMPISTAELAGDLLHAEKLVERAEHLVSLSSWALGSWPALTDRKPSAR